MLDPPHESLLSQKGVRVVFDDESLLSQKGVSELSLMMECGFDDGVLF